MRVRSIAAIEIAVLVSASCVLAQDLEIVSFGTNGEVGWTNSEPRCGSYEVQWSSGLLPAPSWTNSWDQITHISPSGMHLSARVPMFYRVVATPKIQVDVSEYANLRLSNEWVYASNDSEGDTGTNTVRVMSASRKYGRSVYIVKTDGESAINGTSQAQSYILTDMSTGLFELGGQESEDWCNDLDYPIPFLLKHFRKGETNNLSGSGWAGDYSNWEPEYPSDGYQLFVSYDVVDVDVTAGSFSNCVRTTITSPPGPETSRFVVWFAHNVGRVKEQFSEDSEGTAYTNSLELIEFRPAP